MDVLEFSPPYFLEKVLFVSRSERIVALKHYIVENAYGPHVGINGHMVNFRNYLGSHVCGGSTEGIDCAWRHRMNTETKIYKFKLFVSIYKNVLSFNVSMHNILLVQIPDRLSYCMQEFFSFMLFQPVVMLRQ